MFEILKGLFYVALIYGGVIILIRYGIKLREERREKRVEETRSFSFKEKEILKVLLELDAVPLAELLNLYKKQFGTGAARYARKTYLKWQTGKVSPNRQTFERFLIHLPQVMNFDLKCSVVRHLMENYAAKDRHELNVYTDEWEEKLAPLVQQLIDKAYTATLPREVEKKLRWLSEGETQAAQEILKRSQIEEGKIIVSMLGEEFQNIEKILAEKRLKPKVTHELKFPYGTITLNIKKR
ncbi:MAG: hypothetical protein LUM44_04045 [Pyrinomonadaceae bacterium]|nr:hypothetical protein [Pyrinomonadaceae bacterium]